MASLDNWQLLHYCLKQQMTGSGARMRLRTPSRFGALETP